MQNPFSKRFDTVKKKTWFFPVITGLISAMLFASTMQTHLDAGFSHYTTDVGEFQNALPRWGTVHDTGYPLYLLTSEPLVVVLTSLGIEPALSSSFISLIWGTVTVVLLVFFVYELCTSWPVSILAGLTYALSTSFWIDSSIAEVHTMTMAFTVASLWLAILFGKTGKRNILLCLAFVATQGVMHQRSVALIAPSLLLFMWPNINEIFRRRNILPVLAIAILSWVVYLYLPLVEWLGTNWIFVPTTSWNSFWRVILDLKAQRIVTFPSDLGDWIFRIKTLWVLLIDDLPAPFYILGLIGIFTYSHSDRKRQTSIIAGLLLTNLIYIPVTLIIWEGGISDALLAVKLPISMMTGVGTALLLRRIVKWKSGYQPYLQIGWVIALVITGLMNYPKVVAVTHDRTFEEVITQIDNSLDDKRSDDVTLLALWGRSYWGLSYAQAYRNQILGVEIVDHNADLLAILNAGRTLIVPLYDMNFPFWQEAIAPVFFEAYAPGLIQVKKEPTFDQVSEMLLQINEELAIRNAVISERSDGYGIAVAWVALQQPERDYSIAVHLVTVVPPISPDQIIDQYDVRHPVYGFSPTTTWQMGQVIHDTYLVTQPNDALPPVAIRITAYYIDDAGEFVNGEWLTIPIQ